MTLFNFNLPLDLPLELAIDAVSDYSPHPKVHFILTHVGDNDVFRLDPLEIREAELLKKVFQGFSFVLDQACFLVHVGSSHPTKFSQSLSDSHRPQQELFSGKQL